MNQLLLIILAALQFAVFLILMLGKLFIRSIDPKGNLYSIDKWDKALIGGVILCIGVTAMLFVVEKSGNYPAADQSLVDTGLQADTRVPADLLAQYGYELDTSSSGIAGIIRDSLHSNALIIKESQAEFGLDPAAGMQLDSVSNERCFFKTVYISKNAPSAGITIRTIPAILTDEVLRLAPDPGNTYYYFPVGDTLAMNAKRTFALNIPYSSKGVVYCLLTGITSNIGRTQNHIIRKIYWLDPETRQSGEAEEAHFKLVDNLYRKQGF
ncbi:MAG: hypothetical protein QM791_10410 [Ferruginibacter sp.]